MRAKKIIAEFSLFDMTMRPINPRYQFCTCCWTIICCERRNHSYKTRKGGQARQQCVNLRVHSKCKLSSPRHRFSGVVSGSKPIRVLQAKDIVWVISWRMSAGNRQTFLSHVLHVKGPSSSLLPRQSVINTNSNKTR